ncbi:MAG: S9 family peptidase [Phycisphaerales bacterium]|nr:S9 family peptidase [Phycisphaerales bacterium]
MNHAYRVAQNRRLQPRIFHGLLILGLVTGISSKAPAADDVFTFKHLAKLQQVGTARISPDGSHIAYVRSVPRDPYKKRGKHEPKYEDGSAWTELHVIRIEDGKSMPFITGRKSLSRIDWTPDSLAISFLAKRGKDKNKSLYLIPLHGGEARRVLAHKTDVDAYDWNPDGRRVAFLAKDKEPKDAKDLKKKGFKAEVYEEKLKYTRAWIADLENEESEPHELELDGNVAELHWAPDGRRLTLTLAPTPLIDDHYMKRKVHVVDADSGEVLAKIDNPGKIGQVAWSPDGKHLAMISAEDIHDSAAGRLMVSPADGSRLSDLIPNYEGHISSIAWQDHKTIMFIGDEGCETVFGKINIDGSARKIIVPTGGPILSRLSLSKNGQSGVFVGNDSTHPGEVFFMKHGEASPRRMTTSNPWLSDLRFAKQEVVRYKAGDGLEIEGILIHPLDEKPGQRYPLIVSVHGGPEANEYNGWLTRYARPGQIAAAQGFAVLYPNYRGSTGRGVKFSKLGQADYAGPEFDDLVDGVKHLVHSGLVDEKRVGVTGGSYGGFASAWCATALTKHFAASVMFVGISDHISKAGTTDIPNEMYLVHSRRWPWEGYWDWFRERSPLFYTKQARTPILILHGKNDTRVHPSQSMQLYRYLKTIGEVPVRLIFYPGEGHGNRKIGARLDYNLRMMRWMEHYLKGEGGDPPPHEIDYDLPDKDEDEKEHEKESDRD